MKALLGLLACVFLFEGFTIYPSNWIGTYGNGGLLPSAQGIAVGADGCSYVTDISTKRVEKFSKAGTHLLGWGGVGGGPGQFLGPAGIAISPSGVVYVTDVNANRIQRFDSNGAYIGEFGSAGTGDGQFSSPRGIAFDNAGNVYIADTINHRIQKFTATGSFLGKWGTQGTGDGQFSYPYGVAVDAKGDVYVADTYNHRVQKFLSDGTYLRKWGSEGAGDGQFEFAQAICIDAGGSVYVTDANNERVQRFTPRGRLLSIWGSSGNGPGQFWYPAAVATGPNGDVHVVDSNNQRVQVFRRRQGQGHQPLLAWGSQGGGIGQFEEPRGIAISSDGFVYVVDRAYNSVQKFTSFGSYVTGWSFVGTGLEESIVATGAACDAAGNVYVVDTGNGRVLKFSPDGSYIGQFGAPGSGWGFFNNARDIAIDGSGNVYVIDSQFVHRFTTGGSFLNAWPIPLASGIGVDAEGMVYVTFPPLDQVRKYAADGTEVLRWGSLGTGIGQFENPRDVACDPAGYVYVVELSGRVQQFTPMGGYLEEWGQPGDALGQLDQPQMMAVDPAGSVYIDERGSYRVQKFASPPEITAIEDVPGDQGGSVRITFNRSSAEASPGGELYQYRVRRYDPPNVTTVLTFAPGPTMVIVPSGGNSTDAFDGVEEYELMGLLSVPGSSTLMYESYGFSTDDLAPPAPAPFTAAYSYVDNATHLHWGASSATDLREYRLSKGGGFSWSPLAAQPDTGYADVGPTGSYYRIVAVDTSDNVGSPLVLGPGETIDVPAPLALSFALQGAAPNPSPAAGLTLRFTLPDAAPARLELVNVAGRSVWSRAVSGAGAHVVRPSAEFAAGIYFVRLTRGAQALVRRAVVLP